MVSNESGVEKWQRCMYAKAFAEIEVDEGGKLEIKKGIKTFACIRPEVVSETDSLISYWEEDVEGEVTLAALLTDPGKITDHQVRTNLNEICGRCRLFTPGKRINTEG